MAESSTKKFSLKQENLIANTLGWSRVAGSGSRINHPGDVQSDAWVGECKTHVTPGHPIIFKFDVWDKIENEATSQFKQPVLFVDDGSQTLANTWCMVDITSITTPQDVTTDLSSRKSYRVDTSVPIHEFCRGKHRYCIIQFNSFQMLLEGSM